MTAESLREEKKGRLIFGGAEEGGLGWARARPVTNNQEANQVCSLDVALKHAEMDFYLCFFRLDESSLVLQMSASSFAYISPRSHRAFFFFSLSPSHIDNQR